MCRDDTQKEEKGGQSERKVYSKCTEINICIVHTVDQLVNMTKSRGRKCAPLRPLRTPMVMKFTLL